MSSVLPMDSYLSDGAFLVAEAGELKSTFPDPLLDFVSVPPI